MPIALGGKAPRASQAYEGPWCALSDIGGGIMQDNVPARGDCRQPRLL